MQIGPMNFDSESIVLAVSWYFRVCSGKETLDCDVCLVMLSLITWTVMSLEINKDHYYLDHLTFKTSTT